MTDDLHDKPGESPSSPGAESEPGPEAAGATQPDAPAAEELSRSPAPGTAETLGRRSPTAASEPASPPRTPSAPRKPPELLGPEDEPDEKVMSLVDHLTELRARLLICLYAIGGFTVFCLFFAQWLIDWLKATAPAGLRFYTTNPTEAFSVYCKTAAIAGLVLAVPVIFYQLWEFIRPGLKRTEREYTRVFVPAFTICFFAGALFARYAAIPLGVAFLYEFAKGIAEPLYTVGDYTSFVLELMLVCGILFEFPIILYLMGALGLVNSTMLREKRKYVIFWIFVIAAGVTPSTDAGTQTAMALPICVLYEITILVMRMRGL